MSIQLKIMLLFNKKTNENIEIDYEPKVNIRKTFKVTVSELVTVEKEHVEKKYIHRETKKVISSYDFRYEVKEEEEKAKYQAIDLPTGVIGSNTEETELYSQKKEDLDVADLSVYINRVK